MCFPDWTMNPAEQAFGPPDPADVAGSADRTSVALSHCLVTVHDHEAALSFYRDVVGLEVRNDIPMGPMRWLTLGAPGQADVEIVLETPEGRAGDRDALATVVAAGSLTAAIFSTDDCDRLFERAVDAGAAVVQAPADQPYGVRDCAVRDPSNNMVRFTQPLEG